MAKLKTPASYDYEGWSNLLGARGGRESMSIGHNTTLHRVYDHATGRQGVAIQLHWTDVVTFYEDGTIMLDSGGYESVTTKQRMNAVLPQGIGVCQRNYVWTVRLGSWDEDGQSVPFTRGMEIRDGALVAS